MLSATTWVPRGYASEFPEKYVLDDEEMERINQLAQLNLDEAKAELAEAQEEMPDDMAQEMANDMDQEEMNDMDQEMANDRLQGQLENDDDMKEYDLEVEDDGAEGEEVQFLPGLSGEAQYHDGEDPYISLPSERDVQEEKQELQVYPNDNLVLATRTEDDISFLDVYVYDDGAGFQGEEPNEAGDEQDPDVARGLVRDSSLYVHHDLMLPAFPLCVEWVNYRPGSNSEDAANFAAVGTFDPSIEIWNLDSIDKAFPDLILGEPVDSSMATLGKKKKNKKKGHVTTHHTDAVLSLAHNRQFRAVLASTSADHTVKLWDLNHGSAVRSLASVHNGKNVSASQWHPTNGSILLTGGYDSRLAVSDVRISEESEMSKFWKVQGGEEIESAKWHGENGILAGTDQGNVYCFDIRQQDKPLWTLQAHDAGISALEVNPYIPTMLATSAMGEKTVKLWKVPEHEVTGTGPSMVLSRDFGVGNVLSASFAPDMEVGGHMVIGGVNKGLKLWDVFTNRSVRKSFEKELHALQNGAREAAKQAGKSSRIARKYRRNDNPDTVITIDDDGEDEEEEWQDE